MTQESKINQSNYHKAASLLTKLFEFDSDIEKQINRYIQNYGICLIYMAAFNLDNYAPTNHEKKAE